MVTAPRTPRRPAKGTKATPTKAKQPPDQAKQPPRKRTQPAPKADQPAPKPVKLVRKGRAPTAGAKLTRELAQKNDSFARTTLITQAGRLADRLEVIARLLSGDQNAWLAVKVAGQVAHVVLTDVVREEARISAVLQRLIVDIEKLGGKDPGEKDAPKVDRLADIVADHYGERKRA